MINANELRIGNYVKIQGVDKPIQVFIIDTTETSTMTKAEPIPLTEELILKIKNDIHINHMRDELLFSIDNVSYFLKDGIVEVFTTHQSEPTTTVSSFHELQNVHFALRKKELVI
jgi:hypothetical protein